MPAEPGALSPWIPLAVGAMTMVVFVRRQIALQRRDAALLDLRTFGSRNFRISLFVMAMLMLVLLGTLIVLPIYLQNVLGLDTLATGLLLLPGGLLMGLLGPSVGRQYDRVGPEKLVIPGIAIVTAVLWAMTLMGPDTRVAYILAGHVVMSVGFALLFTPLFTASLSSVRPELYSHGSAVLGSLQQVAGAAGVAAFVALMSAQSARLAASGVAEIDALAGGIRAAFVLGAVCALFASAAALLVRKPDSAAPSARH